MIEALKLAQLEGKLGTDLNREVSEGGGNFSHGERQLLAFARAILQKPENNGINNSNNFKGILLLDEATSALDPELDKTIQTILRDQFQAQGCTVITIAHRIQTLMDYDMVCVLEQGEVVEFGPPQELLKNLEGEFYALTRAADSGRQM